MLRPLCKRVPIRGRGYSLAYQACGPLACNMYTLVCEKTGQAAVVDPSFHDRDEWEEIEEYLDGKQVTHILLTHGHADHVAGVADAMKLWPDASLHLHPLEEENYQQAREQGRYLGVKVPTLPEPSHTITDGEVFHIGETIKLRAVHTPGHAPGHIAFVDDRPSKDNKGAVVIGGDLLFRGSVGRTDFHNSSLDDLFASLRRLDDMLDDESIILSGHTTPTKLGIEKESNPFVRMALQRPKEWYDEAKVRLGWS
jgi:hydroxyacylglutathione hydrolase